MPKISALPPAGTLADDDETPFVDDSVGSTKKFTLAGLLVWLQSKTAWIVNAMVADGFCVQEVSTMSTAVATVSGAGGVIPNDDTIPQITEGGEVMTVTITPKSSTNKLVIEAIVLQSNGNATQVMTQALFQDSTANALASAVCFSGASTLVPFSYPLRHEKVAGTTSAITFRIRIGSYQNTTNTFNGYNGGRMHGAITKSSLIVREYKAS